MTLLVQLTNAGQALIAAATGPIILDNYKLGSQYGYVPAPTQTNIVGTTILAGTPAAPAVEDGNYIRYSIVLASAIGPFTYGEVGLFKGSVLFAIAVFNLEVTKLPLDTNLDIGGDVVIDIHLPVVDPNYRMWADVTQANTYKLNVLEAPHLIPRAQGANPNLYMVKSPNPPFPGFLAYTDRLGLWEYDSYDRIGTATIISATVSTLNVDTADSVAILGAAATYPDGEYILQFGSGFLIGHTRYCERSVVALNVLQTQLNLTVPVTTAAVAGDKVIIFRSRGVSAPPGGGSSLGLTRRADAPSVDDTTAATPSYINAVAGGNVNIFDAFGS